MAVTFTMSAADFVVSYNLVHKMLMKSKHLTGGEGPAHPFTSVL